MRKKSQQPSLARRLVGGVAYTLLLLVALTAGSALGWLHQSKATWTILFSPKPPKETFHSNSLTLLVLGCDEDLSVGGKKVLKKQARSDMMLIARLDFDKNIITGVSIPRDTECKYPDGKDLIEDDLRNVKTWKINAYHEIAKKGHEAELTQKAVEYLLPGVKIDRVITLDFDAFQDVVNLIGGVPITVDKPLKYTDKAGGLFINIKAGAQVLDGYNAMCFVRFRHADSDLVRQQRQKQFLLAFKEQAKKNWIKLPQLVEKGEGVLGGALNSDEIASIAQFARGVPAENIDWGQVPVVDGRGSYLKLDKKHLDSVLAQYKLIDALLPGDHPAGGESN